MPKASYTGTLDLSQMVEAPAVKKTSGIDLGQFKEKLLASWERVQAKSVNPGLAMVIPAVALSAFQSRFRAAARELGLGCAFQVREDPKVDGQPPTVTVIVQARAKKSAPAATAASEPGATPVPSAEAAKPAGLPKAGKK